MGRDCRPVSSGAPAPWLGPVVLVNRGAAPLAVGLIRFGPSSDPVDLGLLAPRGRAVLHTPATAAPVRWRLQLLPELATATLCRP